MRVLLCGIFLFLSLAKCQASVDDSLAKGETSRFLAFPFLLRSPETSWGFGAAGVYFFKANNIEKDLRTSDINLISLYTLRKQIVIVLGSTIFFSGEKYILRLQSSYSYYPNKFWGLGNFSPENRQEEYGLKQMFFNPQFITQLYKKVFLGLSLELQNVTDFDYIKGGIFDQQNIAGRNGGFTSGAGILLTYDTRNNSYSPDKGIFAELNLTRFDKYIGSHDNFSSYSLDLRKFIFAGRNRVLAFQSFSRFNTGSTPVRYLSMLGGTEIMRGYFKGRYTDNDYIAFQGELRQFLFWRLGFATFASAGQVAHSPSEFSFTDFHVAYGAGLRILVQEREKLNLRVDFGFGKKTSGVYVILREAF